MSSSPARHAFTCIILRSKSAISACRTVRNNGSSNFYLAAAYPTHAILRLLVALFKQKLLLSVNKK